MVTNNNAISKSTHNPKGSVWHRWDPHIHTPGTVLNNQFTGVDPWSDFLTRIEHSSPLIKVLGITDYYSIENYARVLEEKRKGRLNDVELIFPNIELRFLTGTAKDAAINGHLLVCPNDPEHIEKAKRFLQELEFSVGTEKFRCNNADLIRLGRFHDKNVIDDFSALRIGTNQFKVTFSQLEIAFKASAWAKENILLAISGNTGDGTSGLNNDSTYSSTRQYIERTAQIIFAASEKQRIFWLGKGVDNLEKLIERYGGCKPCIHGSDAHTQDRIGKPDHNRYTWIKGDLTFESLRQICIEPADRVFVGENPPNNQISSNIIEETSISNADWLSPSTIDLNSGLVAIIGARGSGKTALADFIALGGIAINSQLNNTSFIHRAKDHLTAVNVSLKWQTGNPTSQMVSDIAFEDLWDEPRVQYLSQQFVDRLCSSEGVTDELMNEIERVIFVSHPQEVRLGIGSFQELLSQSAAIPRQERINQQEIIDACSQELTDERIKIINLSGLKKRFSDKEALITTDKANRQKLVTTGGDTKVAEFEKVSAALDKCAGLLDQAQRKKQALNELKQEVGKARISTFPNYTKKLFNSYSASGLTSSQWKEFEVDFRGDVSKLLDEEISKAEQACQAIKGTQLNIVQFNERSLLPKNVPLEKVSFEILTPEVARLKHIIVVDS
ncbi:MAG: TrlF family AAA-like ATPase [Ginsengibacter sp.]